MKLGDQEIRLWTVEETMQALNMKRTSAMRVAREAGAVLNLGPRSTRIDAVKLAKHIGLLREGSEG